MLVMAIKRREKKLSQAEVGEKLGVSQVEISYYERGITAPPQASKEKLAELLGVSVEELLMPYREYILRGGHDEAVSNDS